MPILYCHKSVEKNKAAPRLRSNVCMSPIMPQSGKVNEEAVWYSRSFREMKSVSISTYESNLNEKNKIDLSSKATLFNDFF